MTRYPPGHKTQTREHLVETARQEFRARGFDAASIDTLMKAAGLTRGAFYAHFPSKEALVEEVLSLPSGLARNLAAQGDQPEPAAETTAEEFDHYLDPAEREDRVFCPMVAHPMDARRGGAKRAELYGDHIADLIDSLGSILANRPNADTEATLIATLAVGAAILGTSVGSNELATKIETTAATEIRRRLTNP